VAKGTSKGSSKRGIPWKLLASLTGWILLLAVVSVAGRRVHAFVLTDPQFTMGRRQFTVQGAVHASRSKIVRVFESDFDRSVFAVPLAERRRRLLAIDWIRDAHVSRIWPNRIEVRVTERTPVAFVSFRPYEDTSGAKVALIDSFGVILERPAQGKFAFPVLTGVMPNHSERERKRRVEAMLELMQELGPLGSSVSEVDAASPENLGVVAEVDGVTVQLALGEGDYHRRLQGFIDHFPEIRKATPDARSFDLRLEDRITAQD
jgi:cell division protein FtsQ